MFETLLIFLTLAAFIADFILRRLSRKKMITKRKEADFTDSSFYLCTECGNSFTVIKSKSKSNTLFLCKDCNHLYLA